MNTLQIFIAVALAVSVLAFLYTSWRRAPRKPSNRKPSIPGSTKTASTSVLTSEAMLKATVDLRAKNAQWPEILIALNPSKDPKIQEVLAAIRGPHMFVPHTGLTVIESGCRSVRAGSSAREALDAARRGMDKVVRFGD